MSNEQGRKKEVIERADVGDIVENESPDPEPYPEAYQNCMTCVGTGKVNHNSSMQTCPTCNGTGNY